MCSFRTRKERSLSSYHKPAWRVSPRGTTNVSPPRMVELALLSRGAISGSKTLGQGASRIGRTLRWVGDEQDRKGTRGARRGARILLLSLAPFALLRSISVFSSAFQLGQCAGPTPPEGAYLSSSGALPLSISALSLATSAAALSSFACAELAIASFSFSSLDSLSS